MAGETQTETKTKKPAKNDPRYCPKCHERVDSDEWFLDDDEGGYEYYQVLCPHCGHDYDFTIDARDHRWWWGG